MKNKVVNQEPLDKFVDDLELNDYSFACGIHQTSQNAILYTLTLTHLHNFCNKVNLNFRTCVLDMKC